LKAGSATIFGKKTVQATTCSDGTRIVANLSGEEREVEGYGRLPPYAWREESG